MVALLEMPVVRPQILVVEQGELFLLAVQLLEGIVLEFVAEPCRDIPLLICP